MVGKYKKYRQRLVAQRRNALPGNVTITLPSTIEFGRYPKKEDTETPMVTDQTPDGATCGPSTSRHKVGSKNKTDPKKKVVRKSIMTSACQDDFPSLKETYEYEMSHPRGEDSDRYRQGIQNQLSCALVQTITSKNVRLVESILDIMEDAVETLKTWPLMSQYAVTSESLEILDIFIDRGVLSTDHQSVLLHHTARIGNTDMMRKLLDLNYLDVNHTTSGQTPLHVALVYAKNFCARMLLDAGADVHIKDNNGKTALHEAAIRGNEAMVQHLLSLGADPTATDKDGKTPWLYSKLYRHTRTAQRIAKDLPKDHFVTIQKNGKSYLHIAVESGLTYLVQEMLEKGCDPVARDTSGNTPLMLALDGSFLNSAIIKLLLDIDAVRSDINKANALTNETALGLTLRSNIFLKQQKNVVELLQDAGADINAELNRDETLLMRHFMDKDKRDFLIEKGAKVNKVSASGKSVLWVACSQYNFTKDCLEVLLDSNLDMKLGNHMNKSSGTTPFLEALKNCELAVPRTLYHLDCSLNGYVAWSETEEGEMVLQHSGRKEIINQIDKTGELHTPIPLWRLARLSVLSCLPYGNINDKVEKLGLPSIISRILLWRNFCMEREQGL